MSYFEYVKKCYAEIPDALEFGWETSFRYKAVPAEKALDYLRICRLCESLIRAFGTPWPVAVTWKNLPVDIIGAADTLKKGGKEILLNSGIYDTLPKEQILDCYQGVSLHEACHLLFTHDFPTGQSESWMVFWNLFEDERIEAKGRKKCPPFSYYFYVIKSALLDKVGVEYDVWEKSSLSSKLMQFLFRWIRMPETLDDRYLEWEPAGVPIHDRMLGICKWGPEHAVYFPKVLASSVMELIEEILKEDKKENPPSKEKTESKNPATDLSKESSHYSHGGSSDNSDETDEKKETENEDDKDKDKKEEKRVAAEKKVENLKQAAQQYNSVSPRGEVAYDTKVFKAKDRKTAEALKRKVSTTKETAKETGEMSPILYYDEATFGDILSVEASDVLNKVVNFVRERVTLVAEEEWLGDSVPIITRQPLLTETTKLQYARDFEEMTPYVQSLSRAFAIRQGVRVTRMAEKRRGRLSARHISYGTVSDRVFYQNEVRTTTGVTLYILLDESGSMYSYEKIQNCRKLGILLQAALRQVPAVDLAIYGHTTSDAYAGDGKSCMLNIYFDKAEGVTDPTRLGEVAARSNNLDGFAIREVGRRLLERGKNTKKWLLVLSDGQPQGCGYSGIKAVEHTANAVKALDKKGVNVIGVDIEGYACEHIYPNNLKYTNPSSFVTQMRQFVLQLLKQQHDTVTVH
jgi:hypothetical protein